jgi:predicted nucleotidyltransferase/DNA-binding XRE family transcriptional regulator
MEKTIPFGNRLKRLRTMKGITAEQLARRVGVTENAIRKLEAGDIREPRFSAGLRMAAALEADPQSLIGRRMNPSGRTSSVDLADAIRVVRSRRDELGRNGIAHVAIFGSVARGDASRSSDVDVIVTPARPGTFSLVDLERVRALLGKALDAPVDVFTAETVARSRFARKALADAVDAF